MQKIIVYSCLMCLLFFSACNSVKKAVRTGNDTASGGVPSITDTKWKLVEIDGKSVPDTINGKQPFLRLLKSDNRYSGTAGCNGIGGEYKLSDHQKIHFSRGMSTMMACNDMAVEQAFNKMLEVADNYTQESNGLSLLQGKKTLARFEALREDNDIDQASSLNGTWELNYISGPRIAFGGLYPDKKPTITFNLPEKKAFGNSSCNNYNMTFTLDGNSINFADPVSTRMACEGAGEPTFFKMIKTVNKYSITDGRTLTLIMGDIALMRFEKK